MDVNDTTSNPAGLEEKTTDQKYDLHFVIGGCIVCVAIAAIFFQVIFSHVAISQLDLLKQLDSIYNDSLKGAQIGVPDDPSACLQSFPKTWFVLEQLCRMQIPTWNNLSGCGQPILADLANCLFHPLNLLFGVKDQHWYNVGLVAKIVASSIASYWWFTKRGAAPWAAASGAIGFGLYARALRVNELANTAMIPLVFIAFDLLSEKFDKRKVAVAALLLGLSYYSMHPESFFIAAVAGGVLWLVEQCLLVSVSTPPVNLLKRLAGLATSFFTVLILTVAMASPTLIPFIEFLPNSNSYKFASNFSEYIPLEQIPTFFLNPKLDNNLFPGLCTLVALPAFILFQARAKFALLGILLAAFFFQCRPGALAEILQAPPISYILPEYSIAVFMVVLCLFSTWGLTSLANGKGQVSWWAALAFGLASCLVPLIQLGVSFKLVISFAIIGAVMLAVLMLAKRLNNQYILYLIPLLNLISLWAPAHQEVGKRDYLSIPPASRAELITKINSLAPTRFTACGDRLFVPNTSIFYGWSDFRTDTPLNARIYTNYLDAAKATVGYCNLVEVPYQLNKLYDLASVNVIASDRPIRSQGDEFTRNAQNTKFPIHTGRILPGLRIFGGAALYYPASQELDVTTTFKMHLRDTNRYQIQYQLQNARKAIVWRGVSEFLTPSQRNSRHDLTKRALIPIPNIKQKLSLRVNLKDGWTGQDIIPDGSSLGNSSDIELLNFDSERTDKVMSNDGRFELHHETTDGIRVYRNNHALPLAYTVYQLINSANQEDALKIISKPSFDPQRTAVIENLPKSYEIDTKRNAESRQIVPAKVLLRTAKEVNISCAPTGNACLVINELFYPGWNAYIDGKPTRLFKVNSLFKGILLNKGKHLVAVRYEPPYLMPSLTGFITSILVCVICLILRKGNSVDSKPKTELPPYNSTDLPNCSSSEGH